MLVGQKTIYQEKWRFPSSFQMGRLISAQMAVAWEISHHELIEEATKFLTEGKNAVFDTQIT